IYSHIDLTFGVGAPMTNDLVTTAPMSLKQLRAMFVICGIGNDCCRKLQLIKEFNQAKATNSVTIFAPQPAALAPGQRLPIQIHAALNAVREVLQVYCNVNRETFATRPFKVGTRW